MVPGLKHTAYRVQKDLWQLYSGLSAALLELTGSAPGVPFRLAITLSAVAGHADCAGTVTVNGETVSFGGAGRKTTTASLTSLPNVTCSNLDCQVLLEAITLSGAPIYSETLTTITCRWTATQKTFRDSMGNWSTSDAEVLTADTTCNAGDTLRYQDQNYLIKQVNPYSKLSGREFLRRLYVVWG